MNDICLVALVGLPGSGKTTFCLDLLRNNHRFNIIHICYDRIFKFVPGEDRQGYKNYRKEVLRAITDLIITLKNGEPTPEQVPKSLCIDSHQFIILIDDNNYYAGMRYEIFKLSRTFELSYAQIYIPISLESALERNALRKEEDKVERMVITRMADRLEVPTCKNHWEQNTFEVKNGECLDKVQEFLQVCLTSPIQRIMPHSTDPMPQSEVHKIDLILRRRISEIISEERMKGLDVQSKVQEFNRRRKEVLENLRAGTSVGDDDLSKLFKI